MSIELRKNKKDDMLSKRRNVGPEEDLALRLVAVPLPHVLSMYSVQHVNFFFLLSPLQENKQSPLLSIEEIQNGIQSQDGHKQLQVG